MLKFKYYNDNNELLGQNNIPIIRDGKSAYQIAVEEGYNGTKEQYAQRNAKYLGCYADSDSAYEDNKIDIFVKDYYLNSTDGYVYRVTKLNGTSATYEKLEADSNSEIYSSVMNDAISNISQDSETLPIVKAMNSWIQTLTAKTAFVENLFAHNILVKDNLSDVEHLGDVTGGLKSENYKKFPIDSFEYAVSPRKEGWQLGSYVFNDIENPNFYGFFDITSISANDIKSKDIETVTLKSIYKIFKEDEYGGYWEDSYSTKITSFGLRGEKYEDFTPIKNWSLEIDDERKNLLLSIEDGNFYIKTAGNSVYTKTQGLGIINCKYWTDDVCTYGWEVYGNGKLKIFGGCNMTSSAQVIFKNICENYSFTAIPHIHLTSLSSSFGELFATNLSNLGFNLKSEQKVSAGAFVQWCAEGVIL